MSQVFYYPPSSATISGSITVDQGTSPWVVADSAAEASLASIDAKLTNPLPVSGPLTDTQLRATPVPVSGPLTDMQLRAAPVSVSASTLPLPTGAATEATLLAFSNKSAAGFVPEAFDETVITYVGATTDINTVTYKLAGSTVATLTMSYDGSNRLNGVVKT